MNLMNAASENIFSSKTNVVASQAVLKHATEK